MKKKFKFPVLLIRQEENPTIGSIVIIPKLEPIFCFKDDGHDGRYEAWIERCKNERKRNQRPVSAKERAEQSEVQ